MIHFKKLYALIERFREITVLIVGDVMMDHYIWGNVSRISPEAPVPIVEITSESMRLGGAANVVNNIRALDGNVHLCSLVGNDATGDLLRQQLQEIGVATEMVFTDPTRPTTIKTRIIGHHQQIVRVDRELREDIAQELTTRLIACIQQTLPAVDAVIIEDYGKGLVTADFVHDIVSLATQANKIVAVDPKTNHFMHYTGVSVITPNHHEAGAAMQIPITNHAKLLLAGTRLLEQLDADYVLITRGEAGMSLFERQKQIVTHVPAMAQEVYDVTGAGDTVIAVFTLCLAAGAAPVDAAVMSNAAASVVVGKVGTATLTRKELHDALSRARGYHLDIQQEQLA